MTKSKNFRDKFKPRLEIIKKHVMVELRLNLVED